MTVRIRLGNRQLLEAIRKGLPVRGDLLEVETTADDPALTALVSDYGYKGILAYTDETPVKGWIYPGNVYAEAVLQGRTLQDAFLLIKKKKEEEEAEEARRKAEVDRKLEEAAKKRKEENAAFMEKLPGLLDELRRHYPYLTITQRNDELWAESEEADQAATRNLYAYDRPCKDNWEVFARYTEELAKEHLEAVEKAKVEEEKQAWIETHGSERLKEATKRGYDCKRLYLTERLALELPGYVTRIWDGRGQWELKDRSCPSEKALEEVKRLEKLGIKPVIKWAVFEDDDGDTEEEEIVYIENYHDYEVYKTIE